MQAAWLRKQSGQAVVLVAVAVLVLTAILALALDGGAIYLDKRQLQNAADSAALAGAELLMAVPLSYTAIHNQAMLNLLQNLPGTSRAGTACSASCPNLKTIGIPVLAARATAQNANLPYAVVLLQDKPAYAQWSNFSVNGTPGSITMQGGGGAGNRGGMFSNASIAPGNGAPSIIFSPGTNQGDLWAVNESAADRTALNGAGVVQGQHTLSPIPLAGTHLDFPNYPEPVAPAVSYAGKTVVSGTDCLSPGQYTNAIKVQNGAEAVMLPGVYQIEANGADIQGTLRTVRPSELPYVSACGTVPVGADLGVIIEITPANTSGTTTCSKHIFSAASTSTIELTPSPRYFNISIFIEPMPNWQTTCTSAPLGTNVLKFSGGSCYTILGAIYGPADNMTLTGSACGGGVGQIVAWTLTVNGNGNVNETFDPSKLPYMKGLTQ
ncbi:MAG: hypothetical protein AUG96_00535 [Chloroflexi bacterium 13_1_20CM_4_66_15]|nr:MAG: hypothetical protein AUG96_00535 [Chloroflexi bacterium 13_1_20CM_4_66_15]